MARCFRQFSALMWKNMLLKRREWISTLFEFVLPLGITLAMVALYYATKSLDRQYDTTAYSDTWAPEDNAAIGTAAARILPISILPARLLLSQMQLAFVPRTPELAGVAAQLRADLESRYPAFELQTGGPPIELPALSNVTVSFSSESDMENHITSAGYNDPGALKIWAAIVVNSAPPAFDYTIRMNSTGVPWTVAPPVNTLQRGTSLGNFQKYYAFTPTWSWGTFSAGPVSYVNALNMPGFMSLQLAVDRWAINSTVPVNSLSTPALEDGFFVDLTFASLSHM